MLPTSKVKATRINPRKLLIYAKEKMGKSTVVANLDNCLILDLENASEYIDATAVKVLGLRAPAGEKKEAVVARQDKREYYLIEIIQEVRKMGNPYKYIVTDTLTKLEQWCEEEATIKYMNTEIGKGYNRDSAGNILPKSKWESVMTLPRGSGYYYHRMVVLEWLSVIESLAPYAIHVCHVKEKFVMKEGKELTSNDISLTGKLSAIIAADCDAIGYMYAKKNKRLINFATSEDTCGTRCAHLRNKEVVISEMEDNGNINTFWDEIYLPE